MRYFLMVWMLVLITLSAACNGDRVTVCDGDGVVLIGHCPTEDGHPVGLERTYGYQDALVGVRAVVEDQRPDPKAVAIRRIDETTIAFVVGSRAAIIGAYISPPYETDATCDMHLAKSSETDDAIIYSWVSGCDGRDIGGVLDLGEVTLTQSKILPHTFRINIEVSANGVDRGATYYSVW